MKNRFLLLLFSFALLASAQAQSGRIKLKQLETGTEGQTPVVQSSGNLQLVTPPWIKWSDTLTRIVTDYDLLQVSKKEITAGAFSAGTITLTKQDGTTVVFGLGSYYIPASEKAAANGVATLGADGKVPSSQLPAQSVADVYVVASQAAMLALPATQGDFAIRTDVSKTFVLSTNSPGTLADWKELPTGTGITTVNGNAGPNVTLTTDNISEGATNKYYTDPRAWAAVSATGAIQYNTATGVFSHAASGITPGTYNNVTIDANGHATGATNVVYLTATDLTNYYTKAELQTSGQAAVNWNNITGRPSNLGAQEARQEFTGGTSAVLTLTNAPLYPSAVLVFMNGVALHAADYAISRTTLTLGFTREASDVITVKHSY